MAYLKPTRFFTTCGRGLSRISETNAFDAALNDAGIGDYNLVPVSSIIPLNAEEIGPVELPPGTIVFVVMAKKFGRGGKISAGIAWAQGPDERGRRYGCVIESNNSGDEEELKTILEEKLAELCERRKIKPDKRGFKVTSIDVPKGMYGCAIAAVVLI